jgi:hypothetical protein
MRSSSFAPCIVVLFFLLAAGCVRGESAPPREPPVTGATQGGAIGVEPSVAHDERCHLRWWRDCWRLRGHAVQPA